MKSRTINNPIKEKKEISESSEIQHIIPQDKPFEKGVTDEKVDDNLLINAIVKSYGSDDDKSIQLRATCHAVVAQYLREKSEEFACAKNYNILLMYDESRIIRSDADKIYTAVTNFKNTDKPILLILFSAGGFAGSAYLISKLCREYTKNKFIVAVPRVAKSSATLLCCGADEIHMGSLSELGPIDPQIDELPALGLKHSIEHIAELVNSMPNTAELFARYLHLSLPIINLGYYERVAESAEQYAVRLLSYNKDKLPREATQIAHDLVYDYKDHGFVIDKTEAQLIFGEEMLKCNTPEYELSNGIYSAMDFIQSIAAGTNHKFYYIGSFDTEPSFAQLKK